MERLIERAFREKGIVNEIRCEEAFRISEEYSIPKLEIARYCNQHGIKIRACQLGCFR